MSDDTFAELMKSAEQALAYERGEREGFRVTVQAWEQGARIPSDAALKLLTVAKKHPEILLEA